MAIDIRNTSLERRVRAEAKKRGHKTIARCAAELITERLLEIEQQARVDRLTAEARRTPPTTT